VISGSVKCQTQIAPNADGVRACLVSTDLRQADLGEPNLERLNRDSSQMHEALAL